jgi:purine nucleosidase
LYRFPMGTVELPEVQAPLKRRYGRDDVRLGLLSSRSTIDGHLPRMVLDTDAFNEIDDQFALVHAVLAKDRVELEAVYAAPFHNARSTGPADGMRKSYEEAQRVLGVLGHAQTPVLEGATEWLTDSQVPQPSPATKHLIERAQSGESRPLYVVAIGAPTNVSHALLLAPEIIDHIVVVWLGGNALNWPTASEFNLKQDPTASRVLLDSGAAMVHVPCLNVADHLTTTRDEVDHYVRPAGPVGALLAERFEEYVEDRPGISKVIWDLAATAWLLDVSWTTSVVTHSPVLTEDLTWSLDARRHLIAEVTHVQRDAIFADLFSRLAEHAASSQAGPAGAGVPKLASPGPCPPA